MTNEQAVYFIHGCQELRDQVQRMTRHLDKPNTKSVIVSFYTDLRNDGFYHSVRFLLP
jgi:hypothetical protein